GVAALRSAADHGAAVDEALAAVTDGAARARLVAAAAVVFVEGCIDAGLQRGAGGRAGREPRRARSSAITGRAHLGRRTDLRAGAAVTIVGAQIRTGSVADREPRRADRARIDLSVAGVRRPETAGRAPGSKWV